MMLTKMMVASFKGERKGINYLQLFLQDWMV